MPVPGVAVPDVHASGDTECHGRDANCADSAFAGQYRNCDPQPSILQHREYIGGLRALLGGRKGRSTEKVCHR